MWWTGAVEVAGNATAVTVLGWRAAATLRAQFWSLLALQVSAVLWFTSNVAYGLMYVGSETGRWMLWDTTFDDTAEMLQQLAIVALPVATLWLVAQLVRDYWRAASKLNGSR